MNHPSVLVVVLNYRGEDVLLPCLQSILPELGPEDACVVIDNGQEETLMAKVARTFPTVRTRVSPTNGGFAKGMNQGIAIAEQENFDAVWLLNNDAVVQPGALEKMKQAQVRFPEVALFSPLILNEQGNVWFAGGQINFWRMRVEHNQSFPQERNPFLTDFLTGCALFIPRETISAIGTLDERYFLYYEDAEYSLRTKQHGGKLWVVPEAQVVHKEVSSLNPEKTYWLVRSGVEFFFRHTPGFLRPFLYGYFSLRWLYNWLKSTLLSDSLARSVKRAYTDASIR